jgi:hypothetical protein
VFIGPRSLALLFALLAHGVGHIARHLRQMNGALGGPRSRERDERAGKRQRGDIRSHRESSLC